MCYMQQHRKKGKQYELFGVKNPYFGTTNYKYGNQKAQIRLMDLRQKCISYMEIYELDCEIQKKKLKLEKLKSFCLKKHINERKRLYI